MSIIPIYEDAREVIVVGTCRMRNSNDAVSLFADLDRTFGLVSGYHTRGRSLRVSWYFGRGTQAVSDAHRHAVRLKELFPAFKVELSWIDIDGRTQKETFGKVPRKRRAHPKARR